MTNYRFIAINTGFLFRKDLFRKVSFSQTQIYYTDHQTYLDNH